MKKIILFKGGVETLEFFSSELSKAFEKMGYSTFIFDMNNQFDSFNLLLHFCTKGEAVLVTFNFIGLSGESIFSNNNHLFFDEYNVQCINIVVDHPFYYYRNYQRLPKNYLQFCIDRTHMTYMKRFHPNVHLGDFLPLAGTSFSSVKYTEDFTETADNIKQPFLKDFSLRKYDIVFTGNYTPPSRFEREITRLGDTYTKFYYEIIDDLIVNPDTPMDIAFEKHILKDIPDISDAELDMCMSNMIFIDLYIRFYMRGKVIKKLIDSGFTINAYGAGLELQTYKHPENLILHGGVNSLTCLKKLSNAKLSLNIMPWFKDGAHDRIFNAAMNGAVNITDGSKYLYELFNGQNDVAFYQLNNIDALPEIVDKLLKNPDRLLTMSKNTYSVVSDEHTWANRASVISRYIM